MNKKKTAKLIMAWALACIVVLIVVQVMYTIPAPFDFLVSKWDASALLTFLGTVSLGAVTVYLSIQANELSAQYNRANKMIVDLQSQEYVPLLKVVDFLGYTDPRKSVTVSEEYRKLSTDIALLQLKKIDGEIVFLYGVDLVREELSENEYKFYRLYELHCRFESKTSVLSPKVLSVEFCGQNYSREYTIGKSLPISFFNEAEFKILLTVIENSDFLDASAESNNLVKANMIKIKLEMTDLSNNRFVETIKITKMFLEKGDKNNHSTNTERFVAAQYHIEKTFPQNETV